MICTRYISAEWQWHVVLWTHEMCCASVASRKCIQPWNCSVKLQDIVIRSAKIHLIISSTRPFFPRHPNHEKCWKQQMLVVSEENFISTSRFCYPLDFDMSVDISIYRFISRFHQFRNNLFSVVGLTRQEHNTLIHINMF